MGFLALTTRAKAVTQVVGYLMLENGIYLFGLTSAERVPFLVEVGVLLDVFVAVFIMGIVVFHINREFDSISSTRLSPLPAYSSLSHSPSCPCRPPCVPT